MRRKWVTAVVAAFLLPFAALSAAMPARGDVTAEEVDAAVERAVQYLMNTRNADGGWGDYGSEGHLFRHGHDVCGLMGLAYAGVPVSDPRLQKALDVALEAELDKNYAYDVRVIALSQLYPRLPRELQERVKKRLVADVKWIYDAQCDEGDWNYTGTGRGELSNTQMALLALHEASKVLVELPQDVWKKALKRYLETQKPDGGWNYGHRSSIHADDEPYGSMTAAAVASLFIIRDKLYRGTGCPCRGGQSPRQGREVDLAIRRGIEWVRQNFVVGENPHRGAWQMYWPFSCERVGLASGIKYFGKHDWYKEMAADLLANQRADGGWASPSNTALAIAFLVKGRAPVLMNKLQFKGEWNNHPRDLANLAQYVGRQKEQRIQWQVINLDVPVQQWHDAPILYISAESKIELSDEHKAKLRRFTDTGGTILFEASCGNREVALWWQRTCREIWPEWELRLIEREHPLWTADQKISGRLPRLMGASDGVRTFLFYSKADISCPWNVQAVLRHRQLFDLGGNLYMYATDRGKLRSRLAERRTGAGEKYAAATPTAPGEAALKLVRIKHGGEWYLARNYHPWQELAADLGETVGLTVTERDPVAPGEPLPEDTDLLYYSGQAGSALTADGAAWLKSWLAGGGFLVAEAVLGDPEFKTAVERFVGQAGLELRALPEDHPLLTGQMGKATGYDVREVDFSYALRAARVGRPAPELLGIYDGETMVGLFSPFDILFSQTGVRAFGNRGYAANDARAIATNLALFVSTRE